MTTSRSQAPPIYSASESDADILWATKFFAADPFIFVVQVTESGCRNLVRIPKILEV
ncbi:MAG TPA: hypothetical protein VK210_04815 [Terriglobia bacterium]|nr:hypothetical protein [Terriglobia bacterium]